MNVTIFRDRMRAHPLAWIHRAEARSIARELREHGHRPKVVTFDALRVGAPAGEKLLLRLSDPVMRIAARTLDRASIAYRGPSSSVLERCYDKLGAASVVREHGLDVPITALADARATPMPPLVIKPRRGSDSLGLRLVDRGTIPARLRTPEHIVQTRVRGIEITVALCGHRTGFPLQSCCHVERRTRLRASTCGVPGRSLCRTWGEGQQRCTLRLLAKDGGLRNSRSRFFLTHTIYAA